MTVATRKRQAQGLKVFADNAEISVSEQRASRLYGLVMTFYYGKSND